MAASIELQLSSMDDLGSEVIRAFDHSAYSHVDAVLPDGNLLGARSDKCGAVPAGVQIRPNGYATFLTIKRIILPTMPECAKAFYDFLREQIGKGYDQSAILGFMLNRDWREEDSWFCSELIASALEKAEYFSFQLAAPSNKITPSDLLLALSATADIPQ